MLRRIVKFAPLEEALEALLSSVGVLDAEEVVTQEALGRVLAENVVAEENYPPYDMSHMDGFAANHLDVERASVENPVKLRVVGHVTAGSRPSTRLERGTALRVLTGAYLPKGADCVIPQEDVEVIDESYVVVRRPFSKGENVDPAGGDFRRGEKLLEAGRVLRPSDVALLLHIHRWRVKVVRRPRVGLLVVGDELTDSNEEVERSGKVFNTHRFIVEPLTRQLGCETYYLGIVGDNPRKVASLLKDAASRFDAVLTIGGSSVSERDATYLAVQNLNPSIFIQGLKLQPGRVGGFAIIGNKPVILLPGLVMSTINVFTALAYPVLRKMQGREPRMYETRVKATMQEEVVFTKWVDFKKIVWVRLEEREGEYSCYPSLGESSRMGILARSNGYIMVEENIERIKRSLYKKK